MICHTRCAKKLLFVLTFTSALRVLSVGLLAPSCSAQELAIAKAGAPILLPVSISGAGRAKYRFLFLTGANYHAIDLSLQKFATKTPHDAERETDGRAAEILDLYNGKVPLQLAVSARVRGLPLRGPTPAAVVDLHRLQRSVGEEIRGVVGAPFLRERVVQFDFDVGRLRIVAASDLNAECWTAWPLTVDRHQLPWVSDIQVGNRTETFLVNTGVLSGVTLHKWLFDALVRSGHLSVLGTRYGATAEKEWTTRFGRLDKLTWGPFCHRNIGVFEGEDNSFGLPYLARYVITLDLSGQKIYLRKGKRYGIRDYLNLTGLHMWKAGGSIEVCKVRDGSIADAAGVRSGDQLLAINGRKATEMRLFDVRRMIREAEGKQLQLKLKRGDDVIEIQLSVNTELIHDELHE